MTPALLPNARLDSIFIATARGEPMQRLREVEAIAGEGLVGDRYLTGRGYYSRADPCQVTLIAGEALEVIQAVHRVHIWAGEHRRNLVTYGVPLRDLAGWSFQIGEVIFAYDRPRPPCGYLERITERGMTRALGEGAGIGAEILTGGWLHEGDPIVLRERRGHRRRLP
ncbi:MAG: MOSC domain-containing protein [Chthoniobacteraceae bacterium]